MDIDTVDHPPITQKSHALTLKLYSMGHVEEFRMLEKAKIILRRFCLWSSAISIVPKKAEPDEYLRNIYV